MSLISLVFQIFLILNISGFGLWLIKENNKKFYCFRIYRQINTIGFSNVRLDKNSAENWVTKLGRKIYFLL